MALLRLPGRPYPPPLQSATATATIPGLPDQVCKFSCVGCPVRHPPSQHEAEALVEHVRLLLAAVVNLGHRLNKLELHAEGQPQESLHALPRRTDKGEPQQEQLQQPSGEREQQRETLQECNPEPAPPDITLVLQQPAQMQPASQTTPAVPGQGAVEQSSNVHAEARQTTAEGAISDTGQQDLLRLLQGSQLLVPTPTPPQVVPPGNVQPAETEAAIGTTFCPSADKAGGHPVAQSRTLPLPGLLELQAAQAAAEAAATAAAAAPPAPAGQAHPSEARSGSLAAALLATTPPTAVVEDQLQQAEDEERREFEAKHGKFTSAEALEETQQQSGRQQVHTNLQQTQQPPQQQQNQPHPQQNSLQPEVQQQVQQQAQRQDPQHNFNQPEVRQQHQPQKKLQPEELEEQHEEGHEEAYALLNAATAQLQQNQVSHAEAASTFTTLVEALPPGSRLRCSALLNRAHCFVGMGKLEDALADIEDIITSHEGDVTKGFDARNWHKVWMSRGGIHRKLAQAAGGDTALYAKARSDYEQVLAIQPPHEGYAAKASRCLQQLDALRDRTSVGGASGAGGSRPSRAEPPQEAAHQEEASRPVQHRQDLLQAPAAAPRSSSPSPSAKRRRLDFSSPSRSPPPRPMERPAATASPASAGSAPSGIIAPSSPNRFALRALEALGHDCVVAGRSLFLDGAVLARDAAAGDASTSAVATTAAVTSSASSASSPGRPKASAPVTTSRRRVFEVRTGPGGPSEMVSLLFGTTAASTAHASGPSAGGFLTVPAASSGAANAAGFIGECSCRLQGHCKHVAAALCALEKEEKEEIAAAIAAAATAPASPGGAPSESAAGSGGDGSVSPATAAPASSATAVFSTFDPDQRRRCELLARQLERKTNDELKTYLRLNNQLLGGAKAELAQRVAEGAVFGALAPCPRCGGHMHPENPDAAPATVYYCKRLNRDREACGYQAQGQDLERKPFLGAEQLLAAVRPGG